MLVTSSWQTQTPLYMLKRGKEIKLISLMEFLLLAEAGHRLENRGQGKRPSPLTLVKVCPSRASGFLHIAICCDVLAPGLPTRRHYPFSVQTFYVNRRASFLFQDSKWGCQTRLL